MSAPAPAGPPARKPSGPAIYKQSQGADVWPGIASGDKAFVRVMNGELVIFQEFLADGKVAVSIGGRDRVLTRAEWQTLPLDEG